MLVPEGSLTAIFIQGTQGFSQCVTNISQPALDASELSVGGSVAEIMTAEHTRRPRRLCSAGSLDGN